jgi:hypothetical protein
MQSRASSRKPRAKLAGPSLRSVIQQAPNNATFDALLLGQEKTTRKRVSFLSLFFITFPFSSSICASGSSPFHSFPSSFYQDASAEPLGSSSRSHRLIVNRYSSKDMYSHSPHDAAANARAHISILYNQFLRAQNEQEQYRLLEEALNLVPQANMNSRSPFPQVSPVLSEVLHSFKELTPPPLSVASGQTCTLDSHLVAGLWLSESLRRFQATQDFTFAKLITRREYLRRTTRFVNALSPKEIRRPFDLGFRSTRIRPLLPRTASRTELLRGTKSTGMIGSRRTIGSNLTENSARVMGSLLPVVLLIFLRWRSSLIRLVDA